MRITDPRQDNLTNKYQTATKKVLCVCSAGMLRSPTAANVLHQEFGYNTRSAGCRKAYALIYADEFLQEWADEIVIMQEDMEEFIEDTFKNKIVVLGIPDSFNWNDPKLRLLIKNRYTEYLNGA